MPDLRTSRVWRFFEEQTRNKALPGSWPPADSVASARRGLALVLHRRDLCLTSRQREGTAPSGHDFKAIALAVVPRGHTRQQVGPSCNSLPIRLVWGTPSISSGLGGAGDSPRSRPPLPGGWPRSGGIRASVAVQLRSGAQPVDPAAESSFPLLPFSFCLFSILGRPVGLWHEITSAAGQTGALKLDGGVGDAKFFSEALANISQELFALLHVHVWDANVAGERVQVGAERPDVDVVDLLDAGDAQDGVGHFLEHHIPGQAFEQDVSGFFQDAVARPQHQHADGRADGGVHPVCAGRADDQRPGKYADVGESVAKIVNQDAEIGRASW